MFLEGEEREVEYGGKREKKKIEEKEIDRIGL